jgi:hypothetical protein
MSKRSGSTRSQASDGALREAAATSDSLYARLAQPPVETEMRGRTPRTTKKETLDNDVEALLLAFLAH